MKKILKLREKIEALHEKAYPRVSTQPVQYWSGGDWQAQAFEKAYSDILKEIEKLIES